MIKLKISSLVRKTQELAQKSSLFFSLELLFLALITYGIFIFSLGFYWDDWPPILLSHITDKAATWNYFVFDRPFQSWTYYALFPICGTNPAAWQLSAILFRWTATLALFFTFVKVFPKQKVLLQWAAILFLLFPGFADLYASVSFGSHFMAYTAYGLSLLTMVYAFQNRRWFWLSFPLSLIFTAVHLFTMEYFVGLELLRPILLYFVLRSPDKNNRKNVGKALLNWIPWLVVLAFYVYWRMVLYPASIGGQHDSNSPYLILNFISSPMDTLVTFLQTVFSDLKFLLLNMWSARLLPDELPINSITFWLSLLIGFAAILLVYLLQFKESDSASDFPTQKKDFWFNILFGLFIILAGMLPVWSTLRQITEGKWSDRFGLAAMFGAVLILVTILYAAIQNHRLRNILFILLAGFSISYHIRIGNDYRKDFNRQKAFYAELAWRVPSLEPGTAVFSPGIPTGKEADYSYTMGINLLFETGKIDESFNYWFIGPRYFDAESLIADPAQPIEQGLRTYTFSGTGEKIVSIHMPDSGCLWVIDPYYALSYTKDSKFPLYAQVSNEELISEQYPAEKSALSKFITTDAQNTWCYYFEKGDLAQSKGQWQQAISFYDQAVVNNLKPLEAVEYLPFIKAYTHLGQIDQAVDLSAKMIQKTKSTKNMLCQFWYDMIQENPELSVSEIETIYNFENCPSFFE